MLVRALQEFLANRPEISLIFPLGDRQMVCLARHSHMLPPTTKVVMAEPSTVLLCMDKNAMCEIGSGLGIPQCQYATASSIDELVVHANDIGYPCVVKPDDPLTRISDEKAIICHSSRELERRFPSWPEDHAELLIQQFAPGFRHNIQLLAHDGELQCSLETKTLRSDRYDNTGYTVDSTSVKRHPLMHDYCARLLEKLNYTGLGCAQFLLDVKNGEISFLELNPRLGAAFGVANRCGIDFPVAAADLFLNNKAQSFRNIDYPAGRRIAWTHGDLEGMLREYRGGRIDKSEAFRWLRRSATSFVRADVHASWSWRDPLPTLIVYWRLMLRVLRTFFLLPFRYLANIRATS